MEESHLNEFPVDRLRSNRKGGRGSRRAVIEHWWPASIPVRQEPEFQAHLLALGSPRAGMQRPVGAGFVPTEQGISAQGNALGIQRPRFPRSEGTPHLTRWRTCVRSTPIRRSIASPACQLDHHIIDGGRRRSHHGQGCALSLPFGQAGPDFTDSWRRAPEKAQKRRFERAGSFRGSAMAQN